MTEAEEKEKKRITQEYRKLISDYGLSQVFRIVDEKTFTARYEFWARYRDLYRTEDGRFSVVRKYDPEPGGYGEEFVFIEGMTEPTAIEHADALSEEELLEQAEKAGKPAELRQA